MSYQSFIIVEGVRPNSTMNANVRRTQDETVPETLQSPRAKLVYLYLATADAATITDLHDALNCKKITLYSILDTLKRRDLVREVDGQYTLA